MLARQSDRSGVEGLFAVASGARELQVQAVGERGPPVAHHTPGLVVAARRQRLAQQAVAPGQGDQAAAVAVQPLGLDGDVIPGVAFQERA